MCSSRGNVRRRASVPARCSTVKDCAVHTDTEVAYPGRAFELFGGDRHRDAAVRKIARARILDGVKGCAGAERSKKKLWGSHTCICATHYRVADRK